jgi:hypothetical protein
MATSIAAICLEAGQTASVALATSLLTMTLSTTVVGLLTVLVGELRHHGICVIVIVTTNQDSTSFVCVVAFSHEIPHGPAFDAISFVLQTERTEILLNVNVQCW